MSEMKRFGIFGPSESGKTTLARKISQQFWNREKRKTIVYDMWGDDWGQHAESHTTDQTFWESVWKQQNCLIIVDDSSATIKRDSDLVPVFTMMRHHGHKLLVIGHSATDLLPLMRKQLQVLYLFKQDEDSCKIWAKTFMNKDILAAAELNQYEFLYCQMYKKSQKLKATL